MDCSILLIILFVSLIDSDLLPGSNAEIIMAAKILLQNTTVTAVHVDVYASEYEISVMKRDGSIRRLKDALYPYICYKQANTIKYSWNELCSTYDDDYIFYESTGHCYKMHRIAASWLQALSICSSEGGRLAIINSNDEADAIRDLYDRSPLNSDSGDKALIGIESSNGLEWDTIEGEMLKDTGYTKWAPGERDRVEKADMCGSVDRNGLLYKHNCRQRSPFICEKEDFVDELCEDIDRTDKNFEFRQVSRFRCDYTYYQQFNGWLKLHKTPVTRKVAKERCGFEGTKLVMLKSVAIRKAVKLLMQNANVTVVHITDKGLPTARDREKDLTITKDNIIDQKSFTSVYPFVCYIRGEEVTEFQKECGHFDKEYMLDISTGHCYKFHSIAKRWHAARVTCAREGGGLAVINNDIEARVIRQIFASHFASSIPGYYKDLAFVGVTSMGTIEGGSVIQSGYDRWAPGEPRISWDGKDCVATNRNGLLAYEFCKVQMPFFCERPLPTLVDICDDWQRKSNEDLSSVS